MTYANEPDPRGPDAEPAPEPQEATQEAPVPAVEVEAEHQAEVVEASQEAAITPQGGQVPAVMAGARPRQWPNPATRPEPSWRELGWWLSLSETGVETAQARGGSAALRLYYVDQLGLPLWAAAELSLIRGKMVVSAKLLRAIAKGRGYLVVRAEGSDDESCTAILVQASTGQEIGRSTFTIQDAERAGLLRPGSAWRTFPGRMLWARAAKFVLDDFAPDVSLGFATRDEVWDADTRRAEPIGVDAYEYGPGPASEADEAIPF
jgi:hypothetical protein